MTNIAAAKAAEKDHHWGEASALFLSVAHHCKDEHDYDKAAEFFMRAATAGERDERWRKLGYLWIECASALEARALGAVNDVTDPLDSSKHFFPTLDWVAWERFSHEEQLGRAYRNAGYHFEFSGSNQSAYSQFEKSGDAFAKGGCFAEASRSYFHALLSFVERHGECDLKTLNALEAVNSHLVTEDRAKYLKRLQLQYRALAGKLVGKGNYSAASRLFEREAEISRELALMDHRVGIWLGYSFWKWSARYGNSFGRWFTWAFVLFVVLFPLVFRFTDSTTWQVPLRTPRWLDYVYYSVATVTTAPDTSFVLTVVGKYISLAETLLGVLMLKSLLSLFTKRLIR